MSARGVIAVLPTVLNNNFQDEIYKRYIAKGIERLAGFTRSYEDIIDIDSKPKETKAPEQIIADTITGAELVVIE